MVAGRLPDFVIVGATKGATTWIVENLLNQPGVFVPTQELHYFSRCFDHGTDWYLDHFRDVEAEFVGEKSASYLPHGEAPGRLKAMLPRARLIAQLRNPIERAYSDYCMHFRRHQADGDIERYLDPDHTSIPRLLYDGLYYKHLCTYLDLFDAEQIKVTIYDDVEQEPERVFRSICDHIGIRGEIDRQGLRRRAKDRAASRMPRPVRRYLAPLKRVVAPIRRTRAFQSGSALLTRPECYPVLTDALRVRLADYYQRDVEALSGLLGRELGDWLAVPQRSTASA
jgi:hypothetical protein